MPDKKQHKVCFVIGPIGSEGDTDRTHADLFMDLIVRPALESPEFGYRVERADDSKAPGMITGRIINLAINADLAIADLTSRNPNAFYELGIRHAFKKPTVHMILESDRIPFDTQDHVAIKYGLGHRATWERAKSDLQNAVREVEARGYVVTNPVTTAFTYAQLQQSSEPTEKAVSNIAAQVQTLTSQVEEMRQSYISSKALGRFYDLPTATGLGSPHTLLTLPGGYVISTKANPKSLKELLQPNTTGSSQLEQESPASAPNADTNPEPKKG